LGGREKKGNPHHFLRKGIYSRGAKLIKERTFRVRGKKREGLGEGSNAGRASPARGEHHKREVGRGKGSRSTTWKIISSKELVDSQSQRAPGDEKSRKG